jgi:hypothetical protein
MLSLEGGAVRVMILIDVPYPSKSVPFSRRYLH